MKQSSFTLRTNFTIGLICVRNKKSWTESNELCFYKATLNSHNRLFLLFLAAWMHYKGAGVSTHLVGTSLFGGSNPPPSHSHWPDFHWNVSKPWLQEVDLFENYATVAMQSDNVTFLSFKIIKVTSGFNLKKTIFFTRWRHHPKNSWNIFQIQITPLLWHSQGFQGCLEKQNCPLSLNLAVWCAKI